MLSYVEKDGPERKVFTKNFGSLINVLSSTDLYSYFVSENVITLADFQEISSCATSKQKAGLLLTKISATIDAGHTSSFYSMLNIMVDFGNIATNELSLQIRQSLSTTGQSVNGKIIYSQCISVSFYTRHVPAATPGL